MVTYTDYFDTVLRAHLGAKHTECPSLQFRCKVPAIFQWANEQAHVNLGATYKDLRMLVYHVHLITGRLT